MHYRNIIDCAVTICRRSALTAASANAGVGTPPVALNSLSIAPHGSVVNSTSTSCLKLGQCCSRGFGGVIEARKMYYDQLVSQSHPRNHRTERNRVTCTSDTPST